MAFFHCVGSHILLLSCFAYFLHSSLRGRFLHFWDCSFDIMCFCGMLERTKSKWCFFIIIIMSRRSRQIGIGPFFITFLYVCTAIYFSCASFALLLLFSFVFVRFLFFLFVRFSLSFCFQLVFGLAQLHFLFCFSLFFFTLFIIFTFHRLLLIFFLFIICSLFVVCRYCFSFNTFVRICVSDSCVAFSFIYCYIFCVFSTHFYFFLSHTHSFRPHRYVSLFFYFWYITFIHRMYVWLFRYQRRRITFFFLLLQTNSTFVCSWEKCFVKRNFRFLDFQSLSRTFGIDLKFKFYIRQLSWHILK